MTSVVIRFMAVCDHYNTKTGRACTESGQVNLDGDWQTGLEDFRVRAGRTLEKEKGWNVSDGPTLCPAHNTPANRKKKFPEAGTGSLAELMRALKLDT